ncbi:MAG: hypothetical protein IT285_12325, partial [Bdellovibrionales bacterium]|nr:hypothetical protein [Bdellovibrionales bacterium]
SARLCLLLIASASGQSWAGPIQAPSREVCDSTAAALAAEYRATAETRELHEEWTRTRLQVLTASIRSIMLAKKAVERALRHPAPRTREEALGLLGPVELRRESRLFGERAGAVAIEVQQTSQGGFEYVIQIEFHGEAGGLTLWLPARELSASAIYAQFRQSVVEAYPRPASLTEFIAGRMEEMGLYCPQYSLISELESGAGASDANSVDRSPTPPGVEPNAGRPARGAPVPRAI